MSALTDLLDRLRSAADDLDDADKELAVRVAQDLAVLMGRSLQGGTDENLQRELDLVTASAANLTSAAAGKITSTVNDWLADLAGGLLGKILPPG